MKTHQGFCIAGVGFVIAVLSMAPMGLAFIASHAPPAMAHPWWIETVLLHCGFGGLFFGHVVMVIGLLLAAVGVVTAHPARRIHSPPSR